MIIIFKLVENETFKTSVWACHIFTKFRSWLVLFGLQNADMEVRHSCTMFREPVTISLLFFSIM